MECVESNYAIAPSRFFLKIIGIWPVDKKTNLVVKFFRIFQVTSFFGLFAFMFSSCGAHIFLEKTDLVKRIRACGSMSFWLMVLLKYCSMISNLSALGDFLKILEDDWKIHKTAKAKKELKLMEKNAKTGRFIGLMFASFMYTAGLFFNTFLPIAAMRTIKRNYQTEILQQSKNNITNVVPIPAKVLIYTVHSSLMPSSSPQYELLFLAQYFFAFLRYTIIIVICSIMAAYVLHVCGQLDIVMMLLKQYIDNKDVEKMIYFDSAQRHKLSVIVTCHARALRLAARIEKTFYFMNLVDFVGCTFQICFTGFLFVMTLGGKPIVWLTWGLLLISFVFNIFIICHIGEYLTQKCQEIGEMAYNINWYGFSNKRALNLMNIMVISNAYPTRLTAGKMVYLTMTTFSQVLL